MVEQLDAPVVDLAAQAVLRSMVCPSCGADGTAVPIWPFPVGGGNLAWFCAACLFPKLAMLAPPMRRRES